MHKLVPDILYIITIDPDIYKCYNNTCKGTAAVVLTPLKGGEIMAVSKAQQKAVAKYMKNNYDELKVRVPKGRKDIIKAHAEKNGESVNGFVNRAIGETMQRDGE